MSKELRYSEDARQRMLKGIEQLYEAVATTLGPRGRNVIIERTFGHPLITKDGVTVAKEIILADPFENLGVSLIKEAATKTNTVAGDGTTTATVLAYAIAKEGIKMVAAGQDPMELKRGLDAALEATLIEIDSLKKEVDSREDIFNVASISANSDKVIGETIAEAFDHIGKDGVITVEDSGTTESSVQYMEGMQLDKGYLSPYFANQDDYTAVYKDPFILLVERPVTNLASILPLLEHARKKDKGFILFAEDIAGDALTGMIMNSAKGLVKVCAVRTPGFGERKKHILSDMAIALGATVISEDSGMDLSKATPEMLGTCEKIQISSSMTTIVGGKGDPVKIEERLELLRRLTAEATSNYESEHLAERLSRLNGGVAIIRVGASTEAELKEKKHRVEDALSATRAALEDGIVAGGGTTLLRAAEAARVKNPISVSAGQSIGWKIFLDACAYPTHKIAENAGESGDVIVDAVRKGTDNFGWNASTGTYGDMIAMGVIDPAKVTKFALKHAVSVAGLLLTTECAIIDRSAVSVMSNDPMDGGGMM
jgi:chaperonin GroEL